jgi:hypothetical protein
MLRLGDFMDFMDFTVSAHLNFMCSIAMRGCSSEGRFP